MPLIEEDADLVSVVPSSACVRRAAPESGQDRLEGTTALGLWPSGADVL